MSIRELCGIDEQWGAHSTWRRPSCIFRMAEVRKTSREIIIGDTVIGNEILWASILINLHGMFVERTSVCSLDQMKVWKLDETKKCCLPRVVTKELSFFESYRILFMEEPLQRCIVSTIDYQLLPSDLLITQVKVT